MNIQELQTVVRDNLPIKIIVFNNNSVGMVRDFQETYFNSNRVQTTPESGYSAPSFTNIAKAYGLETYETDEKLDLDLQSIFFSPNPTLIEIKLKEFTYVTRKLRNEMPIQDQEPLLDRELYKYLMEL